MNDKTKSLSDGIALFLRSTSLLVFSVVLLRAASWEPSKEITFIAGYWVLAAISISVGALAGLGFGESLMQIKVWLRDQSRVVWSASKLSYFTAFILAILIGFGFHRFAGFVLEVGL